MKLVTYATGGRTGVGGIVDGQIVATGFSDMRALIDGGADALAEAARAVSVGPPIAGARAIAPLPRPRQLLFCGVNYRSHREENPAAVLPTVPFTFSKLPSAVIGPREPIVIPTPESKVDYEVELAVVIGRRSRRLAAAEAMASVFGYTVVNDVSAREVQFVDAQITLGKGFDSFCPMGPVVVTAEEVPDPAALHLSSRVNDHERQSEPTANMIFGIAELLAFVTRDITLEPGDVVSTGTPAGVGHFRTPPAYLRPGDTVTVEVSGIGRLTNPVVAGWRP